MFTVADFELVSDYHPKGDQPKAIKLLSQGIKNNLKHQTLLGVTGSGKTFTMANVIQEVQKPTLVIVHNKTLAAQLYFEYKSLFPNNAVEYFVSYYDYYQPEAYMPRTDTYIAKEVSINEEIEKLRLQATSSLFSREDVIVVASVSCIYGLGSPEDYADLSVTLRKQEIQDREEILRKLVNIQYERNDLDFGRGNFRVRGDTIEIFPVYGESVIRIELFGDEIESITEIHPLTGAIQGELDKIIIFPARHFVSPKEKIQRAIESIEVELEERLEYLISQNKLLEAQRLEQRTRFDLEMLREVGYCTGIENYSRHFYGRKPGEPPYNLLDYFPKDFLMIIEEGHVTIPQLKGMYAGDKSRKDSLVKHGFRLPSAYDNRPLTFEEFEKHINQVVYVSATPGPYELKNSPQVVEQINRPTGLVDPEVIVKPVDRQIDDLIGEIRKRVEANERVLVTTLTKRMAEDLSVYLAEVGLKVRYLHSEIDTIERTWILRDLRMGEFDTLVGINLLREGLDLPEVSLVAILDADKEGFLRNETSLIQTIGRVSRNVRGQVIMYADKITDSMCRAIDETNRRRQTQLEFNRIHNITPQTIKKSVQEMLLVSEKPSISNLKDEIPKDEIPLLIVRLEEEMKQAAENLEFERAAELRDKIFELMTLE